MRTRWLHVTLVATAGLLPLRPAVAQYSPVHAGSIQLAGTAQFTHSRDIGNNQVRREGIGVALRLRLNRRVVRWREPEPRSREVIHGR